MQHGLTFNESLEAAEKAVELLHTERDAEAMLMLAAKRRARLENWRQERFPEDIIKMGTVMLVAAERAHAVRLIEECEKIF